MTAYDRIQAAFDALVAAYYKELSQLTREEHDRLVEELRDLAGEVEADRKYAVDDDNGE